MNAEFRKAIQRLAASAQEQEAYLHRLGTAPSADELALEFNDALTLEQAQLDEPVRTAAALLDTYLAEISGADHAALWTVSALHESSEWTHVRELATNVLRYLADDKATVT